MRLLLVGAFPYPHHQGSQVYFQEQAIALRAAGARVDLLTYASGLSPEPGAPEGWRGLDGFDHWRAPAWTAPARLRSGPSWGKPLADLGLALTLRSMLASKDQRQDSYDAILTHNAEATLAALCVIAGGSGRLEISSRGRGETSGIRRPAAIPIVYCVHTLLGQELSSYPKWLREQPFEAASRDRAGRSSEPAASRLRRTVAGGLDRLGARIDRRLARGASGWIVLTQSAERVMKSSCEGPGVRLPPPIPDPFRRVEPLDPGRAARQLGLEPGGFYLYSGNLDGYQELALLARASRQRTTATPRPEIVLASHDPEVLRLPEVRAGELEARVIGSQAQMLALLGAARASLVARRAEGGFPIKLANSLALGTPPISFLEREWDLSDGTNAIIARGAHPDAAFAAALDRLDRSPDLARHLRAGARALYDANHRPASVAAQTLELVAKVRAGSRADADASDDSDRPQRGACRSGREA